MRSAKISTVSTRRAKRPDGRLLRDMRKRSQLVGAIMKSGKGFNPKIVGE